MRLSSIALITATMSVFLAAPTFGQTEDPVTTVPEGLEWTEIIPGIQFAAAHGDWSKEAHGKFIRFDAGIATPAHTHSGSYHGIVIAGTITNPYAGETDPAEMSPGAYWYVPAGAEHVTTCASEDPCLFYTHSEGPWDLSLVEEAPAGGGEARSR